MQRGHSLLAHGVLALVVVHLVGVALASLRHHEVSGSRDDLRRQASVGAGDVA